MSDGSRSSDDGSGSETGSESDGEAPKGNDGYDQEYVKGLTSTAFAIHLVEEMINDEHFEVEEVGRFVTFLMEKMCLRDSDKLSWLRMCSPQVRGNPFIIAKIRDDYDIIYDPKDLIDELYAYAEHVGGGGNHDSGRFLGVVEEAFEQNLFNVKEEETISALMELPRDANWEDLREIRYYTIIGSFCGSKKAFGRMMDSFRACLDRTTEETIQMIGSIVKQGFFCELTGGLDNFLRGFTWDGANEFTDELEEYLREQGMNDDGEIPDSDADENGNLEGFIDDDDDDDDSSAGNRSGPGSDDDHEEENEEEGEGNDVAEDTKDGESNDSGSGSDSEGDGDDSDELKNTDDEEEEQPRKKAKNA